MTEHTTYCRICEPLCGLVATVEEGRIVGVRGDKENPLSQGFQCVKSEAMLDIVYDDERVVRPQVRDEATKTFSDVSWDRALGDIAERLTKIIAEDGPAAVAVFHGNPSAFNYSSLLALQGLQQAIGTPLRYGINSEDGASRLAASALLYGVPTLLPKPDLWNGQLALVLGANPYVSHGSGVTEPRIRTALKGIVERGGRVIVIDPRRTETARQFEHLPIRSGTDAWLLAALLREILDRPLRDPGWALRWVSGLVGLRAALDRFTPARAEEQTGVPSTVIVDLAESLATSPSALVYTRTGACTQAFGTLVNALGDLVCAATANIDRRGGLLWPWGPIDFDQFAEKAGMATYRSTASRVRGLPEIIGMLPSQALAEDITTPGPGRVRALIAMAGNPVLSSGGGGPRLSAALEQLDLHVALDLYVTETSRHAHYVLPTPTWYERDDLPLLWLGAMLRPTAMATDPVIDRIGDTRTEWEILDDLARRMGHGGAYPSAGLRRLAKLGIRVSPRTMADALLRLGPAGDRFGLRRGGLSWRKLLRDHPHGVAVREELPVGVLGKKLRTDDRKIRADHPEIIEELSRLDGSDALDPEFPMRAHGQRTTRSQNTWMHNSERLMPPTRRYEATMNTGDASARGIADGDTVEIRSCDGRIRALVRLSDDESIGNISLPHGWGQNAGWTRANAAGGPNSNELVATNTEGIERLAGMSVLNGIPVEVRLVRSVEIPVPEIQVQQVQP
jgi:formate dehydrogenase